MRSDLLRTRGFRRGLAMAAVTALGMAVSWASLRAAGPGGYRFDLLASVGDPLPGPAGGTYVNDFEPGIINNSGDLAFGADVSTGGEGIFLRQKGQVLEIMRSGGDAPGGGTLGFGFLGPVVLNSQGDVAVSFVLEPNAVPIGNKSGVYRYSRMTGELTPVLVPGVTPVPGGGGATFQGTSFSATLNNAGDLAFPGMIATDQGVHIPGQEYPGLGVGIFQADRKGRITRLVVPGDPAPDGGQFDYANSPRLNQGGDIVFVAHVAGDEALIPGFPLQTDLISALTSLYVRDGATGTIRRIVHAGETPAPGGGVFRQAFHTVINNRGDVVFAGDLTPAPDVNRDIGAFLYTGGKILAVARPGDPMPGGGNLVSTSLTGGNYFVNNNGEVVFSALLDSDVDNDGTADTAVFQWSNGRLSLIARSGDVLPGIGTIYQMASAQLIIPPPPYVRPNSGAINNDRGQVVFQPTLTDGRVVMIQATPTGAK
jgi:hypothetical protein